MWGIAMQWSVIYFEGERLWAIGVIGDGRLRDNPKIRALGFAVFDSDSRPFDYQARIPGRLRTQLAPAPHRLLLAVSASPHGLAYG